MDRHEAIEIFKALFPPDTDLGKELLEQAKLDCNYCYWEYLPDNVLLRYAELCQQKESQLINFLNFFKHNT